MTVDAFKLLLFVCCVTAVQPVLGTPAHNVDQIAAIIENNYYDAAGASRIANELRAEAKAGQFDSLTNPGDLAAVLTKRLFPFDHHFAVTWSAEERSQSSSSGSAPIPAETLERRNAYGFRRVEMLPGAIGYIDLRMFADFAYGKPSEPARMAADAALALVSDASAIIIDLRNNGGGSPAMVGYLVSAFTPPDADIYNVFHSRDGSESERPKESYPKPRLDVPLYVLISGRTASAAESAAYTLQAAKRAIVVGEVSEGAANPGGEIPAGDGFRVFVSTSTAVNAVTGTNWEGVGVKPDVPVAADHALERANILALETLVGRDPDEPETVETRWILEALRAEHSPHPGPPLAEYVGAYTSATVSITGSNLALRRGRRPAWTLVRLRGDVFFVRDEPFRRVAFERGSSGRVERFQLQRSGGPSRWYRREK